MINADTLIYNVSNIYQEFIVVREPKCLIHHISMKSYHNPIAGEQYFIPRITKTFDGF